MSTCIGPTVSGAVGKQGNVYLVPGQVIGQVHSGYGNGYGGSRLDQTASAFYLHFASERNYPMLLSRMYLLHIDRKSVV